MNDPIERSAQQNPNNYLASLGLLLLTSVLALLPYLITAAMYGTADFSHWPAHDTTTVILLSVTIFICGIALFVVREKQIDLEKIINNHIDTEEYKNKKYLDLILSHYGNVAAVAAFFVALIYLIKSNMSHIGITGAALVISLLTPVIYLFYSLVFLKCVFGTYGRSTTCWVALVVIFSLDVVFMTIAIGGTG